MARLSPEIWRGTQEAGQPERENRPAYWSMAVACWWRKDKDKVGCGAGGGAKPKLCARPTTSCNVPGHTLRPGFTSVLGGKGRGGGESRKEERMAKEKG